MLQGDGWKEPTKAEERLARRMPRQKPGRSKQDYGTPKGLIAAVKQRLGITEFDIDLAADSTNKKCPRWVTEKQDALSLPTWKYGDGWNWLNPPFGRTKAAPKGIENWVRRAYAETYFEKTRTAVLIPASTGAQWWADYVHEKCKVVLVRPRPVFEGTPVNPKTGKPDAYPKDVALLLYGEAPGYEIWRWK